MQSPFNLQPNSGSYFNLRERILKKVLAENVEDQVFNAVQKVYEDVTKDENIVLSRLERKRLFSQIVKLVLDDMLKKIDNASGSG